MLYKNACMFTQVLDHVPQERGSIDPGKIADFIVCTRDLRRKAVFLEGVQIS